MESADCAVAVQPSIYFKPGANELERFIAGAVNRDEIALVVSMVGFAHDEAPTSVFHHSDDSFSLPDLQGNIGGSRLLSGTRPKLVPGLNAADRDLGLRLLNRSSKAPWWSLQLRGITSYPGGGGPPKTHEADGELHPILIDALGMPVVAVYVPSNGRQRWYVIPDQLDWNTVLDWIVHKGLPAYAPGVLRRLRVASYVDPELQTPAESVARQDLADMEIRHAEERTQLEADLSRAENEAETIRSGLLYGTGSELVDAVAAVLQAAGFTTVDLDAELGATSSADLLASLGQRHYLIEVKSQGGNAAESLVGDLLRHLGTWGGLRPKLPVDGGALVVNNQHKLTPDLRSRRVYSRPEFVQSLTTPVVGTRDLFDWWRQSDWQAIQHAVMGTKPYTNKADGPTAANDRSTTPLSPLWSSSRSWFRRKT
ncbi:hypothetical protein [Amycolatopsis sp. lyj-90]|uniref:hypothetical protein n=1 Tax=Amycolatopsis sp. lyj-90 TaxID=2789285 RepID=UPI00397DF0F2